MTKREKFFWGGLGAVVPLVVSFLALDPNSLIAKTTQGLVLFYAVRTLILFGLGGVTTFFEKTDDVWMLIRMGVAAPALFAGLVTHNTIVQQAELQVYQRTFFRASAAPMSIISSAFASDSTAQAAGAAAPTADSPLMKPPRNFSDEEIDAFDIVKQATSGDVKPTIYLIAGERDTLSEARRFAEKLYYDMKDKHLFWSSVSKIKPEVNVYVPYHKLKFTVVVGGPFLKSQADELTKHLLENDFKGVKSFDLAKDCYEDECNAK